MVSSLRYEIDKENAHHEDKIQKQIQLKTAEFKQLQETITQLRLELEKANGRKKSK